MKLQDVMELVEAKLICGPLEANIDVAFASDLMSDVLAFAIDDGLLVTGLSNVQTIRTAEMAGISYILFVRSKKVTPTMKMLAEEHGITLLESDLSMFKACGLLYKNGIRPCF